MTELLEISRFIAADPEAVYGAISDVTRMGDWSTECHRCEWTGESTGPAVGATFDGHNRHGDNEWTTQCTVIEADPSSGFAFECALFDFHFATWGYRIEAADGGSTVTEWWQDLRPDFAVQASKEISGVEDRDTHNATTMSATLERLAAALEA